jgi:hypothetical protein
VLVHWRRRSLRKSRRRTEQRYCKDQLFHKSPADVRLAILLPVPASGLTEA